MLMRLEKINNLNNWPLCYLNIHLHLRTSGSEMIDVRVMSSRGQSNVYWINSWTESFPGAKKPSSFSSENCYYVVRGNDENSCGIEELKCSPAIQYHYLQTLKIKVTQRLREGEKMFPMWKYK